MTQQQKKVIKKFKENHDYAIGWFNHWFRIRWNEEMQQKGML